MLAGLKMRDNLRVMQLRYSLILASRAPALRCYKRKAKLQHFPHLLILN